MKTRILPVVFHNALVIVGNAPFVKNLLQNQSTAQARRAQTEQSPFSALNAKIFFIREYF